MGKKTSNEEQKWASRVGYDLKKELQAALGSDIDINPLQRKCPVDGVGLVRTEIGNSNIYFSKCELCDGIWLERGDIEKLFQASSWRDSFAKFLAKTLDIKISKLE